MIKVRVIKNFRDKYKIKRRIGDIMLVEDYRAKWLRESGKVI